MPELLEFVGLAPFTGRLAANLSGGMRQKLGLVCSLIHRPQVLFLDEPTFGQDPVSRREFWHILYQLHKTGITIILSTAYMDEAERAHRVGLMHEGRLLVADTPQAIKAGFEGELLEVRAHDLRGARRVLEANPLARQVLAMGDRLMVTVEDLHCPGGPCPGSLEAGRPARYQPGPRRAQPGRPVRADRAGSMRAEFLQGHGDLYPKRIRVCGK